MDDDQPIYIEDFTQLTQGNIYLKRVYEWDLVIHSFKNVKDRFQESFEEVRLDTTSKYSGGEAA